MILLLGGYIFILLLIQIWVFVGIDLYTDDVHIYYRNDELFHAPKHLASICWSYTILPSAVSMVMFATFEHSVDFLYRKVVQRRKEDCSIAQQLGVTCLAGYASGSVGSIISNPADNIVASLYNKKANSLKQVLSIFLCSHFSLTFICTHWESIFSHYYSPNFQAIKKIGLLNLFTRSLPIRIFLVGPVVTMQWFFYDAIRVLNGL